MDKYDLTVLCPAIRVERWVEMYQSIAKSFSGKWELIIITSKDLPKELKKKKNIKLIYSRRSPMGKQQEGLIQAEGEWITVVSDDSSWLPGTLDTVFKDKKNYPVIVMKYLEGKEFVFPEIHQKENPMQGRTNYDFMRSDAYYITGTHHSSNMNGIAQKSPILSVALIKRQLLLEVGGWDCVFQSQAMGNIDLAARFSNMGIEYYIHDLVVSKCGYMEQDTGDHGPIHYAQLEDDQPLLNKWWKRKSDRGKINLDNWKESPEIWERGKDVN